MFSGRREADPLVSSSARILFHVHRLFHRLEQLPNDVFLARFCLRHELCPVLSFTRPSRHRCVPLYTSVVEPNFGLPSLDIHGPRHSCPNFVCNFLRQQRQAHFPPTDPHEPLCSDFVGHSVSASPTRKVSSREKSRIMGIFLPESRSDHKNKVTRKSGAPQNSGNSEISGNSEAGRKKLHNFTNLHISPAAVSHLEKGLLDRTTDLRSKSNG